MCIRDSYYTIGDEAERYIVPSTFFSDSANTYTGTIATNNLTFKTNRAYLFDLNEQRSKIRVIDPNFIDEFAKDFETLINE